MIKAFINKLFGSKTKKETREGTVKFFNSKKGYGFITIKDTKEEIFVHSSNIIGKIRDKNKVTFSIEKSDKGPVAVNVRVLKKS
jgi:CspA family cold shock protein